jgi:hypothetical protein
MTPDEQRSENTVQENRAIEEGLEAASADSPAAGGAPEDEPPVDVQTE